MLGIFQVLNWIESDYIDEGVDKTEVANVKACLIITGEKLAQGICDRF